MTDDNKEQYSQFLEFIIDRVNVGIFIVNPDMEIVLWNQFMASHSGLRSEEVMGQNLFDFFPELPKRWFKKKIKSVILLKSFAFTSWEQREYLFKFPHNRPITGGVEYMQQDCTLMPLKDEMGEVQNVCIAIHDATDASIFSNMLKGAIKDLEAASRTDGLTKIYNRHHWEQRLNEEFLRAERYGDEMALIMFDLDHFKSINDNYGHLAGDEVLRRVSTLFKEQLRATDIPGRYGGEEFGLILPATDLAGAELVAERIRKAVDDEEIYHNNQLLPVAVSLGITIFSPEQRSYEALIGEADSALYYSKENGRNRWTSYPKVKSELDDD